MTSSLRHNAYVERYNRTVRYSWLSQYLIESIQEVQDYATGWLWFYNHERPNKANGGLPPREKEIEYYQQLEESAMAA